MNICSHICSSACHVCLAREFAYIHTHKHTVAHSVVEHNTYVCTLSLHTLTCWKDYTRAPRDSMWMTNITLSSSFVLCAVHAPNTQLTFSAIVGRNQKYSSTAAKTTAKCPLLFSFAAFLLLVLLVFRLSFSSRCMHLSLSCLSLHSCMSDTQKHTCFSGGQRDSSVLSNVHISFVLLSLFQAKSWNISCVLTVCSQWVLF